ncbi:MAG: Lrp/AsnC family transcriptional regulator [Clostridiales bacterium]|nr:Lrp/AsnC family transcriptional regulator [Clostridiales bacterium]
MIDDIELLKIIEKDPRAVPADIAVQLGVSAPEVEAEIERLKEEKILLGYTAEINWAKSYPEKVTALIEVRITPQRDRGFDNIAKLLSKYDKVTDCYLMSGAFDLLLIYNDDSLKNIAEFVYNKVATSEGVLSTATHFILKKYKSNGIFFEDETTDDRQAIVL